MRSKLLLLALACLAFAAVATAQGAPPQTPPAPPSSTDTADSSEVSATGTWEGAIEIPGSPLGVVVTLAGEAGSLSGTIDIPAQGAAGMALTAVSVEGQAVTFAIANTPGSPTFDGTLDGDAITGTFTQSGQAFPFTLTRAGASSAGGETDGGGGVADTPAVGPDNQPATDFTDPQGRYTLPVPTGWTASQVSEDHVLLAGPDGEIHVHVVVSQGEDLEGAIAQAWATAEPDLELEPDQTFEPPASGGIERTLVTTYDADDETRFYQASAQLHDGTIYSMLVDASLVAFQRRTAQVGIVSSGFTISAVDQVDLSGAEPLAVDDMIGELEVFITTILEDFGIPGAAVAIVEDGEVAYAEGFGVTEVGSSQEITPATQMMIGSVGKTMTSMLTATLVDDGVIEWDTPVVEVLPEFAVADPDLTQSITMRNLLCACTGVPRRDLELFFNRSELGAEGIVESLGTFEFFTDFGEAFQYSNQIVATAGYAAAAAAGAEYGDFFEGYVNALHERVLDPIGLYATTLSMDEVVSKGEHAMPHEQNIVSGEYEPIGLENEDLLTPIAPAGSHWSTAMDMARYLITELQVGVTPDGARVVSEENLRETWEPQVPVSATESYGLGWFRGEWKGLERLYHGGNTLGFTSELTFVPQAGVGIVVLTNARNANTFTGAVTLRVLELIYDQPADSAAQATFTAQQLTDALAEAREQLQDAVDASEVEPWLGTWSNPALGTITLAMEGDQLTMDAGEFKTEVRPIHRSGEFDMYVTYGVPLTGLPVDLTADDEGEEVVVLGQGAISYTFERASDQ